MSPIQIQVLLHYFYSTADFPGFSAGRGGSPALQDAVEGFLRQEFLESDPSSDRFYRLGERGRVYVEALCAVPAPVRKWAMP